ncbi:hypothetical protein C8R43DRAFT_1234174 [Mycena crocata]|nr:hypothetical protein C8R43DRAFT_1234174 [Mycena crocata]
MVHPYGQVATVNGPFMASPSFPGVEELSLREGSPSAARVDALVKDPAPLRRMPDLDLGVISLFPKPFAESLEETRILLLDHLGLTASGTAGLRVIFDANDALEDFDEEEADFESCEDLIDLGELRATFLPDMRVLTHKKICHSLASDFSFPTGSVEDVAHQAVSSLRQLFHVFMEDIPSANDVPAAIGLLQALLLITQKLVPFIKACLRHDVISTTAPLQERLRIMLANLSDIETTPVYAIGPTAVSLPPEIIFRIFSYCIIDEEDEEADADLTGESAVPVVLASVCSYWRAIALSHRDLWTNIDVHFCSAGNFELLKTWLARTVTRKISVRLSFTPWNQSQRTWEMIDALAAHASQWEDIDISLPDSLEGEKLRLKGPFRALRRISLTLPFREYDDPEFWTRSLVADLGDAPLLQEVCLVRWNHDVVLPWAQLTTITMQGCRFPQEDVEDGFRIFHGLCPNLVECTLDDNYMETDIFLSGNRRTNTTVRNLYLYNDDSVHTVRRVSFSALRRLRLHMDHWDEEVEDDHWLFFYEAPEITSLYIRVVKEFTAENLFSLLSLESGPVALRSLKIEYTRDKRFNITTLLKSMHEDYTNFLPNLTRFELIPPTRHKFPYLELLRMLAVRADGFDACVPLKKFTMSVKDELEDTIHSQFELLAERGLKINLEVDGTLVDFGG